MRPLPTFTATCEGGALIGSRANLLIEAVFQKPGELRPRKAGSRVRPIVVAGATPTEGQSQPGSGSTETIPNGAVNNASGSANVPAPSTTQSRFGGYLRPVDNLPDGVLYRPLMDAEVGLVVEVNISHPFAKAVFEVPSEGPSANSKRSVPRRATTAIQQMLYVLGFCEFTMSDDKEVGRVFEQYRRYVSMNVTALVD